MHALVLQLSAGVITTETNVAQNVNSVAVRKIYLAGVPTSQMRKVSLEGLNKPTSGK